MNLSEPEQKAKSYLLNLLLNGTSEPCDTGLEGENFELPPWYDENKFKRGQRYCEANRSGLLLATFYGGISVICDPKTAAILARGKARHPRLARNRGILTALSMTSWFRTELTKGSKSHESLKRVRRIHLHASRAAEQNNIEGITQYDMCMQHFAVMGYVLTKPHHLGIAYESDEDRRAFVHFYAVVVHMLGIRDPFNMCLYELEVVQIICRSLVRYAFLPFLQIDTEQFATLTRAFTAGINELIPFSTYESQLFMLKRLNSVFGYQYNVDVNGETLQRQIFSSNELNTIKESLQYKAGCEHRRNLFFDENVYLLRVVKDCERRSYDENWREEDAQYLRRYYAVGDNCDISIARLDEDSIRTHQTDEKIHTMARRDRFFLFCFTHFLKFLQNPIIKAISNKAVDFVLTSMERELQVGKK